MLRQLRRISAVMLAGSILSVGFIFAPSAGASTVSPDMYCAVIGGYEICGSAQYITEAEQDVAATASTVQTNLPTVQSNLCGTVSVITTALGLALDFLPETAIINYIIQSLQGVTVAELQQCSW